MVNTDHKKRKSRKSAGKWHKWMGLFITFFVLVFAISGVFLNHRKALSSFDIPRSWLPKSYQYADWNLASIKGSLSIAPDSILLFGGSGIWLTDSTLSSFLPFTPGIKKGADNRITNNIIKTASGELYAITSFDLYSYDKTSQSWINQTQLIDTKERLTDLASHNDTLVVLSRSHAYIATSPYSNFEKIVLKGPKGVQPKVSLFKTFWTLHSGELFGMTGRIIVDFLGIITLILCLTGLLLFFMPKLIRRRRRNKKNTFNFIRLFKNSLSWHNNLGFYLFSLLLILCLSGMFLRPPLLIAIIKAKHSPLPLTTQDKTNLWKDKLRCIRYDESTQDWVVYTSDGFFSYSHIKDIPLVIKKTPPISVMGLEVFHPQDSTQWIIGSFSGLYYWNRITGESYDYFTGELPQPPKMGPPVISTPISGFSSDFNESIVFNYFNGVSKKGFFPEMPKQMQQSRISLWHLSLEAHTGRIYTFLPELVITLFPFISGILLLIVLISGYLVYKRRYKR